MRQVISIFASVAALLLTGCASTPPKRPPILLNIPAEVAAEFRQAVAAWNAGDLDAFVQIYSDNATFSVPEGFLHGRSAIRAFYAPNFERGAVRDELTLEQVDVEVLSPEAAFLRGIYQNRLNGEVTRRGPTTLILRHIMGRWQIVHDHSG